MYQVVVTVTLRVERVVVAAVVVGGGVVTASPGCSIPLDCPPKELLLSMRTLLHPKQLTQPT